MEYCLLTMAAVLHILEPRWLLAALAKLRLPCATLLARLAPSLACFPSVHSVTLSLPYLGLGFRATGRRCTWHVRMDTQGPQSC